MQGEEQNGFRMDRGAEDNMFVVNELIEKRKREEEKLYLGFLDIIEKAYDRVDSITPAPPHLLKNYSLLGVVGDY